MSTRLVLGTARLGASWFAVNRKVDYILTLVSNSNQVSSKSFCAAAPSLIRMLWIWILRILGGARGLAQLESLPRMHEASLQSECYGGKETREPTRHLQKSPCSPGPLGPCEGETCSLGISEIIRKTRISRGNPPSSVTSAVRKGDTDKPQATVLPGRCELRLPVE